VSRFSCNLILCVVSLLLHTLRAFCLLYLLPARSKRSESRAGDKGIKFDEMALAGNTPSFKTLLIPEADDLHVWLEEVLQRTLSGS
jgi:hypothetical protein